MAENEKTHGMAQNGRDYKLRYKGGGSTLYRPKQPPKASPIWPNRILARRPDKGNRSRIIRVYPHSPKRKTVLKNPYGIHQEQPEELSATLERLKKAGVVRRKELQQTSLLAETRRGKEAQTNETALIKTLKGSQLINRQGEGLPSPTARQPFSGTANPNDMYLLTNFLAFDKIDEHERSEIMGDFLDKWLSETYELDQGSDALWHYVRTYCESSCMLDRITTHKNSPNPLSAAACCEILDVLSKKELRYARIFRLLKSGIHDAIYVSGRSERPYFHREAWFTRAQMAEKALRKTRMDRMEADMKGGIKRVSMKSMLGKYLPEELAAGVFGMGPEYTTAVIQNLTAMQRNGFKHRSNNNMALNHPDTAYSFQSSGDASGFGDSLIDAQDWEE